MQLINLTPHPVNIAGRVIPPSGTVARVSETAEPAGDVDGIPVVQVSLGTPTGLPDPAPDTAYIVSPIVAQSARHRADLLCPDTGPDSVIRDANGAIVGVKRLRRFS